MIIGIISTVSAFAQTASKTVAASEIIKQINQGGTINYENVTVTGDFDLSKLTNRTNDAVYPENGKTARVYSAKISSPVSFKNVVFSSKVDFFGKEETAAEIKEYRIVFADNVKFENCTFNEVADFELTNFEKDISFKNSVFKAKPSFIRVGLERIPDFSQTIFEKGSIFKNFQNDPEQNLTATNLESFYRSYLVQSK